MYKPKDRKEKRGGERRGGDRDFKKRKRKVCFFCAKKTIADFKNLELIRRFVNDRGKIMTRRGSGCCARHQRMVAKEIKRARQIGMLPYKAE